MPPAVVFTLIFAVVLCGIWILEVPCWILKNNAYTVSGRRTISIRELYLPCFALFRRFVAKKRLIPPFLFIHHPKILPKNLIFINKRAKASLQKIAGLGVAVRDENQAFQSPLAIRPGSGGMQRSASLRTAQVKANIRIS